MESKRHFRLELFVACHGSGNPAKLILLSSWTVPFPSLREPLFWCVKCWKAFVWHRDGTQTFCTRTVAIFPFFFFLLFFFFFPQKHKTWNCACHILVLLHFYPEKCVNKHFFVARSPLPDVFILNVLIGSCVPLSHNELKRELAMCSMWRILLLEQIPRKHPFLPYTPKCAPPTCSQTSAGSSSV